jgi:hypothetical protein
MGSSTREEDRVRGRRPQREAVNVAPPSLRGSRRTWLPERRQRFEGLRRMHAILYPEGEKLARCPHALLSDEPK